MADITEPLAGDPITDAWGVSVAQAINDHYTAADRTSVSLSGTGLMSCDLNGADYILFTANGQYLTAITDSSPRGVQDGRLVYLVIPSATMSACRAYHSYYGAQYDIRINGAPTYVTLPHYAIVPVMYQNTRWYMTSLNGGAW